MGKRGPSANSKKKKTYVCEPCNKSFRDSFVLKVHNRIHTGEKPHSCDICNRTFAKLNHRDRHKLVHTGERPYACDICGKSFGQSYDMQRHRARHTGEKFIFSCDYCDKSFMLKANLEKHMLSHEGHLNVKTDGQSKLLTKDRKKNLKKAKAKPKRLKKEDSTSDSEASAQDYLQDEFSDENIDIELDRIKDEHDTESKESTINVKTEDNDPLDISRGIINTNELETVSDNVIKTKVKSLPKSTSKVVKNQLISVKKSPKSSKIKSSKTASQKTTLKSLKRSSKSIKTETSPKNITAEASAVNNLTSDEGVEGGDTDGDTEKAFLCPIDGCDEIRLSSDLKDGADMEHLLHDHGLKKVQINKMDLNWQLVAICRFKSRSNT